MRITERSIGVRQRYLGRRALIRAIESIWGEDTEMVYLVLWMWGSEEAASMAPPPDIDRLVAAAVAGPWGGDVAYARERLSELHGRFAAQQLLAA